MIRYIERNDEEYLPKLLNLSDPPEFLRVKGKLPQLPLVSIVGTRRSDFASNSFAHKLASDLVMRGFGIISGGALGIDTAAHTGALEKKGITVAVLGSGFNHIYPNKNRKMFELIAQKGAVVSEFPDETPPTKWTFPRRNRIVAALSSAVIVVQAPVISGALITARIARKMGIPVGAVPAAPSNSISAGCNKLIKEGSFLIETSKDVLNMMSLDIFNHQLDLPLTMKQVKQSAVNEHSGLTGLDKKIYELLSLEPLHIDIIAYKTELSSKDASIRLFEMEMSGLVKDLGGKRFVRL